MGVDKNFEFPYPNGVVYATIRTTEVREVVNKRVENSLSGSLMFDIMQPVSLARIAPPLVRPLW
jgi:hypothetical protein